MILLSGIELPVRAINEMIASAIHIIVQINRFSDGTRRITGIAEVTGLSSDFQVQMSDVFVFRQTGIDSSGTIIGGYEPTGYVPKCFDEFIIRGFPIKKSMFSKQAWLFVKIINKSKNTILANTAVIASTFFSRMTGLLNRSEFSEGEALVITQCQSIHMFFMQFPIDAVFVDKNNIVVGMAPDIKPNQISKIYLKASSCIELPLGVIAKSKTFLSDQLEFV